MIKMTRLSGFFWSFFCGRLFIFALTRLFSRLDGCFFAVPFLLLARLQQIAADQFANLLNMRRKLFFSQFLFIFSQGPCQFLPDLPADPFFIPGGRRHSFLLIHMNKCYLMIMWNINLILK